MSKPAPITADALGYFEIALETGAPADWETAARELAKALTAPRFKPSVVPLRAPKALDLAERYAVPKSHAAGAFTATWADGSETYVSAVAYPPKKAGAKWAGAFQAADRLRRARGAKAYLFEHGLTDRPSIAGPLGIPHPCPRWLELNRVRPLPALLSLRCETTGAVFEAPDGSAAGAGDAECARDLVDSVLFPPSPLCPIILSEGAAEAVGGFIWGGSVVQFNEVRGAGYWKFEAEDSDRPSGYHHATGWVESVIRERRRDAVLAFTGEDPTIPVECFDPAYATPRQEPMRDNVALLRGAFAHLQNPKNGCLRKDAP